MADQIGVAVENAGLFEETTKRAIELSALYSVATVVNQSLDIKSVLHGVMDKILEIFSFDAALIRLLSEDGKELRTLAKKGSEGLLYDSPIPLHRDSINRTVIKTGKLSWLIG